MKSVLVTGAASGLGRHLALKYENKGYLVYALDINKDGLEEIASEKIIPIEIDISKENIWDKKVIPIIEENTDTLNIVIACAGVMRVGNVEECSMEDWKLMEDVNLTGHFLTAKKTMRFLKESRGNILFIGSPSAKMAVRDEVCYITFKHALCGLSKSIAFDYGYEGVRSNIVHPGWMRTAMSDEEMKEIMDRDNVSLDEAYDIATRYIPLRRAATLDEIWDTVEFLTSNKSTYVTGAELMVDGGITIVDAGMMGFM